MNKNKIINATYIILLTMILISSIYIFVYHYDLYKSTKQSFLLSEVSIPKEEKEIPDEEEVIKTERMLQVEELQKENPDIIGWLEVPNTYVNFPVLQGEDNDFYLNHDYKKQKSKNGAIFLDFKYDWSLPSSNLLIYGHNMKNNTMFQDLLKYKNEEFYKQNPNIRFTTISEDVNYEIIAVIESKVYYETNPKIFEYYTFINAENEEQYNYYIDNVKALSLYDTGKTAEFGEQLMTLSTCAYHTKDGRFAIILKKSNEV